MQISILFNLQSRQKQWFLWLMWPFSNIENLSQIFYCLFIDSSILPWIVLFKGQHEVGLDMQWKIIILKNPKKEQRSVPHELKGLYKMTVTFIAHKNVHSPINVTLNNDMHFWNKFSVFRIYWSSLHCVRPLEQLLQYLHRSSVNSVTSLNLLKNAKAFVFAYNVIRVGN